MRFQPGKLYSLLDILGGQVVCDTCGAESESGLTSHSVAERAKRAGWQIQSPNGGRDLCPRCIKRAPTATELQPSAKCEIRSV